MKRKITVTIIVIICFLLQCTLFKALSIASISPNLLIIVTSSFGFMRGKKDGMLIGFFAGLLIDIFYGGRLGFMPRFICMWDILTDFSASFFIRRILNCP